MSEALVAQALELIAKRGTLRSPAIAEALDVTVANVHALLAPAVAAGKLIACSVQVVDWGQITEYRLSTIGGGALPTFTGKTGRPPSSAKPEKHEIPFGRPSVTPRQPMPAAAAAQQLREQEERVSNVDKVKKAFQEHGPMTLGDLRKHVKIEKLAVLLSNGLSRGAFERIAGKRPNIIYGLPGQKAPAGAAAAAPKKATGGGTRVPRKAKAARKPRRIHEVLVPRAKANGFRPAITADGALLLTGAERSGELNGAETRVLAEFLLRMNAAGVRA